MSPVAYDSDDDASPNFIISAPSSDPGLVSATNINLGSGQPSAKGWKTTALSNTPFFTPSSFAAYVRSRTNFKTITSLTDITTPNYTNQILFYNGDLTLSDPTIFSNRSLVMKKQKPLRYNLVMSPTIHRIGPHRFFFFSGEGNEPPHIHVETAENSAKFWLSPVELVWTVGYNSKEIRKVRELVEANQELFLEKWYEHLKRY